MSAEVLNWTIRREFRSVASAFSIRRMPTSTRQITLVQ
jgi:hypothetical protein